MRTAFIPSLAVIAVATLSLVATGALRFAGSHEKVDVCHKGRFTINIDSHAVPAHLAHGDQLGACGGGPL